MYLRCIGGKGQTKTKYFEALMQGMETNAYSFISYGIHNDVVYGKWELIDL